MKPRRACELCINGEAVVHCEPDSAYLCRACDAHVHGANFLVARHPRRPLCRECGVLDSDQRPVSGLALLPPRRFVICRSCNDAYRGDGEGADGGGSDSDSESESESASSSCCSSSLRSVTTSSCVSTAGSEAAAQSGAGIAAAIPAGGDGPIKVAFSGSSGATELSDSADRRRRWRAAAGREVLDARTESIVVSWCRRIGLDDARASGAASRALISGVRMMTGAPFRVAAAAAVWHAARVSCAEAAAMGGRRGEAALLRRLEACSGVPAKVIVVAEARLARAIRRCHVADEEEGWTECS